MRWRSAAICGTTLALIGAVAGVAAGALTPVPPRDHEPADDRLPVDMVPSFVEYCSPPDEGGAFLRQYVDRSWEIGRDAVVRVELSYTDPSTGSLVVDEAATAVANACLSKRRVVYDDIERFPTPAQVRVIQDWFWRWEAPCLTAHGMSLSSPEVEEMLEPRMLLWYLRIRPIGGDFEAELAARLACESIPAYLQNEGVGF